MEVTGKKITASKEGYEDREFSEAQWARLGVDKNGWKVKTPGEAADLNRRLQMARENYKTVTGKEAPEDKDASYLEGVIDAFRGNEFKQGEGVKALGTDVANVATGSTTEASLAPFGSAIDGANDVAAVTAFVTKAATTDGTDSAAKVTKETYKAPRSTDDAKALYLSLFGVPAAEDMSFTLIKNAIEAELEVEPKDAE